MVTEKISIRIGPPVEGNEFYGREKELEYAWKELISKGTSLKLFAPRRVGKSSFAKKMLNVAEENGWKTLYLDLSGISTESEFVRTFREKIQKEKWWKNLRSNVKNIILKLIDSMKDLELAGNKVRIDTAVWRDTYEKIKQLIESAGEILIVMDELTIFLDHLLKQENGKEKVEIFLEWLRSIRQISGIKARWIFCSSVGIENFASMHQLSKHLNDLYSFAIEAFSEDKAKDFISRLDVNENIKFKEEHIQHILDKLVWYLPFFIQLLVGKIDFLIRIENKQLSHDTIDEAYNRLITENEFGTWSQRLEYYYELETTARKILGWCTSSDGRSRDALLANLSTKKTDIDKISTMLSELLAMLINDGYLVEYDGKYIFRSPLLRDFWYNRYVK